MPQPIEDLQGTVTWDEVVFRGPSFSKAVEKGRASRRPADDIYDVFAKFLASADLLKAKRIWEYNGKEYVSWRNRETTVIVDMEHDPRVPVEGKPAYYAGTVQLCLFKGRPAYYEKTFRAALAKATLNVKNNRGKFNPTEEYRRKAKDAQLHEHLKTDSAVDAPAEETEVVKAPMDHVISPETLQVILMMRNGYGRMKIN